MGILTQFFCPGGGGGEFDFFKQNDEIPTPCPGLTLIGAVLLVNQGWYRAARGMGRGAMCPLIQSSVNIPIYGVLTAVT